MSEYTQHERIEMLQDAQGHLREALELVREATRGTEVDVRHDRTLIPAIEQAIDDNHEWLGRQDNIQQLIDFMIDEYEDDDLLDEDDDLLDEDVDEDEELVGKGDEPRVYDYLRRPVRRYEDAERETDSERPIALTSYEASFVIDFMVALGYELWAMTASKKKDAARALDNMNAAIAHMTAAQI